MKNNPFKNRADHSSCTDSHTCRDHHVIVLNNRIEEIAGIFMRVRQYGEQSTASVLPSGEIRERLMQV